MIESRSNNDKNYYDGVCNYGYSDDDATTNNSPPVLPPCKKHFLRE
jgi:hypothetical protein